MKQPTDLHELLAVQTTDAFDAEYPDRQAVTGIRPLVPIVVCHECERLKNMLADAAGMLAYAACHPESVSREEMSDKAHEIYKVLGLE